MLRREPWDSPSEQKPAFVPRAERFDWSVPLVLATEDGSVAGRSINISQSGILASFNGPVDIWVEGDLSLTAEDYKLTIPVRAVRLEGKSTGLKFMVRHDGDRAAIRILMEIAAQQAAPAQPN